MRIQTLGYALFLLALLNAAQSAYQPKNNKMYIATYDESIDKEATFNKVIKTKANMVYLQANGSGEVQVSYTQPESNEIVIVNCRATHHMYCPIFKQLVPSRPQEATLNVTMKVQLFRGAPDRKMNMHLIEGQYIEFASSHGGQISLERIPSVDIVCFVENGNPGADRVQFVANHNWLDNLATTENLSMSVKPGAGIIQEQQGVLNGTETIALGIVQTIEKGTPGFCVDEGCAYSVRIDSSHASGVLFRMFLRKDKDVIPIDQSETFIDQLKENSQARYIIRSMNSAPQEVWNFMLIPIEGNPDLYINEISKCEAPLSEYRWSSTANSTEAITIHMKELQAVGLDDKEFCVVVKDTKPTTFALQIDNINEQLMQLINVNIPYSGELFANQVNRYVFRQEAHFAQSYKMNIDLKAVAGNPDLYIKECRSGESCDISEEDIANRDSLASDPSIYFRYSAKAADDTLPLEFNCRPSGNSDTFDNGLFTSETCTFEIAVHSKAALSKYSLVVRGRNHLEMFGLGSWNRFMAWQNQIVTYRANINKLDKSTKSIEFEFNLISGDAEICLTRTIDDLNAGKCSAEIKMDNDNKNLYSMNKKFVYGTKDPADLIGSYFLQINVRSMLL